MSSNLLKRGTAFLKEEETCIIDSNALVAQKIGKAALHKKKRQPEDADGFTRGILADVLEVSPGEEQDLVLHAATLEEDDTGQSQSNAIKQEAGPSAEELKQQALIEIEKMKEEAAILLETERNSTFEKAKEQGYTDGFSQGMQETEVMKKQLTEEKIKLKKQYEDQIHNLEPQFIDALTGIYEHIFNVDLSGYRDILVHLIIDALRKSDGDKDYIIHVSKEDYPYVSMQKKQIAANASGYNTLEIIEDIGLSKNQAMIETGGGIFDCSLGTQLSELGNRLKLLSYDKPGEE